MAQSVARPAPSLLNVHTPTTSFSIVHSLTQDTLQSLYDKLTRKVHTDYHGARVGTGWLKYEHNESIWNLDDDSDYTIFTWRLQSSDTLGGSSSSGFLSPQDTQPHRDTTPTLHLHNPTTPLPVAPSYTNTSYYSFKPAASSRRGTRSQSSSPKPRSVAKSKASRKTTKSKATTAGTVMEEDDGIPVHKKKFDKFHSENGVRTVLGSIGPVKNVRMLLKTGYRHVYISRKFAMKHGFIPDNAAPGYYGYGGLVNIGTWPVTLKIVPKDGSSSTNQAPEDTQVPEHALDGPGDTGTVRSKRSKKPPVNGQHPSASPGQKPVLVSVYLSEEPHFDVVLGRSFLEKRHIRIDPTDMTNVVCMDTGDKIHCELVILKDGRGEIVTVT